MVRVVEDRWLGRDVDGPKCSPEPRGPLTGLRTAGCFELEQQECGVRWPSGSPSPREPLRGSAVQVLDGRQTCAARAGEGCGDTAQPGLRRERDRPSLPDLWDRRET